MTVGEAAKRSGLTARAVRLYEAEGLLPPAPRTPAGYRTYTERDVELLRAIARLRTIGLRLHEIREFTRARASHTDADPLPPPPEQIVALLEAHLADADQTIQHATSRRRRLADLLHHTRSAASRGEVVRLCRLL